jgi:hypothetical protein
MAHRIEDNANKRGKNSVGDYLAVGELFGYFIRVFKKDPSAKPNFNLKAMHTINKISILMFLAGIVIFIIKVVSRS